MVGSKKVIPGLSQQQYSYILTQAGVPDEVIQGLKDGYLVLPETVVSALIDDDGLCGIGPISFGNSPECRIHDFETLLESLGYPITTNSETMFKFQGGSIKTGLLGLRDVLLTVPKIVIGGGVGWGMWLGRLIKRRRSHNG